MPIVRSGGQLETVAPASRPALSASLQLSSSVWMTYSALYAQQPQVRTVVSFLARNISQLGIHSFKRLGDNDRVRLRDHPLPRLLARPAPGQKLTHYGLLNRLVSDLGIYDNALWVKVRPDGKDTPPGAILPVPWSMVEPLGTTWLTASKYRIGGSRGMELDASEVVHFHGYNPDDMRVGQSALESLRGVLAEEFEASVNRQQMWRNGARASGYLSRPVNAPDWSGKAKDRFLEDFRSLYSGGGAQAGGVPLLEDGMTFTPAGLDPKSAQYIEGRKLTREEVASAYHIPPPLVGILDHATFSNIREQHKQLYQDTLGPWLTQITEDIEQQLLPDLDDSPDVYCEFNIAEKLSGSFEEQAAQLQAAVGGPYMSRNEARSRMNLSHIDGGDELITPLNVLVGGQASPQDSAPDDTAPA